MSCNSTVLLDFILSILARISQQGVINKGFSEYQLIIAIGKLVELKLIAIGKLAELKLKVYIKLLSSVNLRITQSLLIKILRKIFFQTMNILKMSNNRPSEITHMVTNVTCRQTVLHKHKNFCTLLIPLCKNNLNLAISHTDHYTLRK